MKKKTCATCQFWSGNKLDDKAREAFGAYGWCYRFPPTVVRATDFGDPGSGTELPLTAETEWCGEWRWNHQSAIGDVAGEVNLDSDVGVLGVSVAKAMRRAELKTIRDVVKAFTDVSSGLVALAGASSCSPYLRAIRNIGDLKARAAERVFVKAGVDPDVAHRIVWGEE